MPTFKTPLTAALALFILLAACSLTSLAAPRTADISSCKINPSNKNKIIVTAKITAKVPNTDGKFYLFNLKPYQNRIQGGSKPLASSKRSSTITLLAPLNKDNHASILYDKFVIAVKRKSGGYESVSDPSYLTNPEAIAKYRYSFPKAYSKKGLQVNPQMIADSEDLGVQHAAVNILLDDLMVEDWQKNDTYAYSYRYQGKTYWFSKAGTAGIDGQTRKLTQNNVVTSGILLLRGLPQASVLMPPGVSGQEGAYYYGLNTMNKNGVNHLAAVISFLGERYMGSSKANGRIVNWIVGNEVDFYSRYNHMGNLSISKYSDAYARSFRVISTALRSVYSNARVYISLTNCFNQLQPGGGSFTARSTLDGFVKAIKSQGNIPWHVAYHPYPQPLTDPVFWDDLGSNSSSSSYVTMNNIGVLTNYVKRLNKNSRVILTEQGFSSYSDGRGTDEDLQAAAYAYAYYIAEFNSQIDSFIITRHVDHVEEESQGIYNGIWSNTTGMMEEADKQKRIWKVFKYIDTTASKTVSSFALRRIGIPSFSSKIPGFTWNRFRKMTSYDTGYLALVKKSSGSKSLSNNWNLTYNADTYTQDKEAIVDVDENSNKNMYKGVGQSFRKPLNFKYKTSLTFQILVSGLKAKEAEVRVRFYNGNHIYEAASSILTNRQQEFSVNLSKWKFRNKVSKLQIWVKPASGSWNSNGQIKILNMKQVSKSNNMVMSGFKNTLALGKKMQLKITSGPQKVTWTSSKPAVATVSRNGLVKAKKRGTAAIKAKIGDDMVIRTVQIK